MKHICCIMGLFIAYFATAQKRGVIAMSDPDYLHSMSWNNHVQQIVDTSYMEVLYDLAYKQRPTSETALNMVVSVQIGQTCILYYSLRQRLSDDIGRKKDSLRHGTSIVPGMSIRYEMNEEEQLTHAIAGDDRINSEILMNRSDGILTERCHDYGRYDTAFGYTEQLPTFSWQTAATADSIAGYVCFQARTEYRGYGIPPRFPWQQVHGNSAGCPD